MKSETLSLKTIISQCDFPKKAVINSIKRLNRKDLLVFADKLEKVPDPRHAKEHYESFLRRKNRKSVKQAEIITYQPKTFDIVDIKSVIIEHPKSLHKLSKIIKKGKKVSCNSSLYSDTKNVKIF